MNPRLLAMIRRHGRNPGGVPMVLDLLRLDRLQPGAPGVLTFTRNDERAMRRRHDGSVGPSRTNHLRNSTMQGAGPDLWPTHFAGSFTRDGLVTTINGVQVIGGKRYLDVSVAGTTTAPIYPQIRFDVAATPAKPGEAWTQSCTVQVIGGSVSGIDGFYNAPVARDAAGANVNQGTTHFVPTTSRARSKSTITCGAGTVEVLTIFGFFCTKTGAQVSIRFLLGEPQLEPGTTATPPIDTAGAPVTTTNWPRTNKCANNNTSPTSLDRVTLGGDHRATLTLVDDTAALAAAGLLDRCSGQVYRLDNSKGTGNAYATVAGAVGTLDVHTLSAWMREIAGSCRLQGNLGMGATDVPAGGYSRVTRTGPPAAASEVLQVFAFAGGVVHFILNQLEEGDSATAVIPVAGSAATVATPRWGDLEAMPAHVGRIDYTAHGTRRGLFLESAATQEYDHTDLAQWAPRGQQGGLFTPDGSPAVAFTGTPGALSYIHRATALQAGSYYHRSVEAKALAGTKVVAFELGNSKGSVSFNLGTLAVTGNLLGGSAWVEPIEDGFCRLHHLFQAAADHTHTGAYYVEAYGPAGSAATYVLGKPSLLRFHAGNGAAMSHLPTNGATVSRAHETARIALVPAVHWNGQEWACAIEFELLDLRNAWSTVAWLRSENGADFVQLYLNPNGTVQAIVQRDGVQVSNQIQATPGGALVGGINRLAFSLTAGQLVASLNGAPAGTFATPLPIASLAWAHLGERGNGTYNYLRGWFRTIRTWPRAMNAAEAQEQSRI